MSNRGFHGKTAPEFSRFTVFDLLMLFNEKCNLYVQPTPDTRQYIDLEHSWVIPYCILSLKVTRISGGKDEHGPYIEIECW